MLETVSYDYGPIHYRLGGLVLNQDGRVRFPLGLPIYIKL
jgi:hypothetical protein